jgi:hypothetical protein
VRASVMRGHPAGEMAVPIVEAAGGCLTVPRRGWPTPYGCLLGLPDIASTVRSERVGHPSIDLSGICDTGDMLQGYHPSGL